MDIGGISLALAFLAGLVSCLSPCVLPLAPIYVASMAGGSAPAAAVDRVSAARHGSAFLLGFFLTFLTIGASVGLVGFALRAELPLLQRIGGLFVIVMGLHMTRLVEIPFLYRALPGVDRLPRRGGYLSSFLTGSSLSAGWVPCIGPTLGAILTLALTSGTVVGASVLLLVYSLGMALPFAGIGVALSRTPPALRWMSRHEAAVRAVSGVALIAVGVLLFTGTLQWLNAYFRLSGSGLGARI